MEPPKGFRVEGAHSIEWTIILDKNLYVLKDSGLELFEKLEEGLEAIDSFQSQVDPCIWYKEEMVLLFYIADCLIFSPSKDKIDELFASLLSDFRIEDDGDLNKYIGIDLDRCQDESINIR